MQNVFYEQRNIEDAVHHYSKTLFRICFTILSNRVDAEDAVQESFVKYLTKAPTFTSQEHEKAWLIRVATNISKNMAIFRMSHNHLDIDNLEDLISNNDDREIFIELMKLPPKYKLVMDLFYIEGYRVKEITKITSVSETAVRKRLQHGRELLKKIYCERSNEHEQGQLC